MGCCCGRVEQAQVRVNERVNGEVASGDAVFFRFTVSNQFLFNEKKDVLITVTVTSGRLEGIYVGRDQLMPPQRRKIWSTSEYCRCDSCPSCDHTFPDCSNFAGGVCRTCMAVDESDWRRVEHRSAPFGGHANKDWKSLPQLFVDGQEKIADHVGYTFSIRLECRDATVVEGDYYLSVVGLPRHPFSELDQQRMYNNFVVEMRLVNQRGHPMLGNGLLDPITKKFQPSHLHDHNEDDDDEEDDGDHGSIVRNMLKVTTSNVKKVNADREAGSMMEEDDEKSAHGGSDGDSLLRVNVLTPSARSRKKTTFAI